MILVDFESGMIYGASTPVTQLLRVVREKMIGGGGD